MSPSPRRIGAALLLVVGLFFVVRAVAELVLVDPGRPETYRDDWGGPRTSAWCWSTPDQDSSSSLSPSSGGCGRRGRVAAASPAPQDVDERPRGAGQNEDDDERRPQRQRDRRDGEGDQPAVEHQVAPDRDGLDDDERGQ